MQHSSSSSSPSSSSTFSKLSSYDQISTISEDFRIRSTSGGLLSLLALGIILSLLRSEYSFHLTPSVATTLYVNSTFSPPSPGVNNDRSASLIPLEFDITFHSLKCSVLSIDAVDLYTQPQSLKLSTTHHIYKRRVDGNGRGIGGRKKHKLGGTLHGQDGEQRVGEMLGVKVVKDKEGRFVEEGGQEGEEEGGNGSKYCQHCPARSPANVKGVVHNKAQL